MEAATIHVLVRRERDWYVAQFLEYDFATQARSLWRLKREIKQAVLFQIKQSEQSGREIFYGYPRAPQKFWDIYAAAELKSREMKLGSGHARPRRVEFKELASSACFDGATC